MTKIGLNQGKDRSISQVYEAITIQIKGKGVKYPFDGICAKDKLKTKDFSDKKEVDKFRTKIAREYMRLVKSTIKFPNRVGYMLDEVYLGDDEWNISSYVDTYENNVKTIHILEYELYKLYQKNKSIESIQKITRELLLDKLPLRKAIHSSFQNECDILLSGKGRISLLSVQMFVMVKKRNNSYDALRIRRSANVSAKAHFLQFIPSGGFEAMNDCNDFDSQWDNYSIVKVLFRELLEECFGQDEDDANVSENTASPEKIYSNKNIKKLLELLECNPPRAELDLVGLTMSLVGLRQELCFVLKVDDISFAEEFIGNYESKSAIHFVDIKNLENASFWLHGSINDLKLLNCTSAGLFELARKSRIYEKVISEVN